MKHRADFIFLSGDQVPDFRTINAFRARPIKVLPKLFAQIVMICVELDMVDFQHLAIDGQKIKANANYRRSKNRKRTKKSYLQVKEGIEKLLAKEVNEEFTEEKKQQRLAKLEQKKRQLLNLKRMLEKVEDQEATLNMTDPEAAVMKHKDGRSLPSYNHQSAVDGKLGVVCAVDTRRESDKGADLFELVDQAKQNTGEPHGKVLADPAFSDYEVLQKADREREEEYFLPDKRFSVVENGGGSRGKYDNSRFVKTKTGRVICPAGKEMELVAVKEHEDGHTVSQYAGRNCPSCPEHAKCTKSERRTLSVDSRDGYRQRMRAKLRSDYGRETYMKRQGIVEPVHGYDQMNKGWRQHHLRGKAKATAEFLLVRIACSSREGIQTVGRVPERCSRFSPRASNLSVLFTMAIISFALRACTNRVTMPASSISTTIQYQLPMVSTATGEPGVQRERNCRMLPGWCAKRGSQLCPPDGFSTDAKVYRLCESNAIYSICCASC